MRTAELASLPLAERLAAMEVLWDSLVHDPRHNPSPAWHADVLAQRRQEMAEGKRIPWDQAKQILRALTKDPSH